MKVLNVSLAVVVSLLLAVGLLELGLRALGFGPPNTGLRFDARLGWALQQDHRSTHRGREHHEGGGIFPAGKSGRDMAVGCDDGVADGNNGARVAEG